MNRKESRRKVCKLKQIPNEEGEYTEYMTVETNSERLWNVRGRFNGWKF